MLNWFDRMILSARLRLFGFAEEFKNDESGVSNFVATVLLILMVVIIGGVVWGFLSGFFTDLFKQITVPSMSAGDIQTK